MDDVIYTNLAGTASRTAVTVAAWHNRPDALVDEYAYHFSERAEELGMDPWSLIDGVDRNKNGTFQVYLVNGACLDRDGSAIIYVKPAHASQL